MPTYRGLQVKIYKVHSTINALKIRIASRSTHEILSIYAKFKLELSNVDVQLIQNISILLRAILIRYIINVPRTTLESQRGTLIVSLRFSKQDLAYNCSPWERRNPGIDRDTNVGELRKSSSWWRAASTDLDLDLFVLRIWRGSTTIENPGLRLGRWHKSCAASVVKHRSFVPEVRPPDRNIREEAVSLKTSATDRYRYRSPAQTIEEEEPSFWFLRMQFQWD